VLAVGFDGVREQVEWQRAELARLTGPLGGRDPRPLAAAAWTRLTSAARVAFSMPAAVMTLAVLPSQVAEIMEQGAGVARGRGLASAWAAHAGVGVVRGALASDPAPKDPGALAAVLAEWREMAHAGGGHANLESAPLAVKSQISVWDDPGAAGRIMERIKAQLDPRNILNPGRFVAGI
jgi:glycolate oxidase FAD binding subunit